MSAKIGETKTPPGDAVNIIRGANRQPAVTRSTALSNSTRTPDDSLSPDVIRVPLRNGGFTLIDAADAPLIEGLAVRLNPLRGEYVDVRLKIDGRWRNVMLHRFLMNPPEGMIVDHINRNGLDNRRCNLRVCTLQQNAHNRGRYPNVKAPYIGVKKSKGTISNWEASIKENGKRRHLGSFPTPEEAARAYDRAAREMRGEFAYLNFPDESEVA